MSASDLQHASIPVDAFFEQIAILLAGRRSVVPIFKRSLDSDFNVCCLPNIMISDDSPSCNRQSFHQIILKENKQGEDGQLVDEDDSDYDDLCDLITMDMGDEDVAHLPHWCVCLFLTSLLSE